MIHTSLFVIMTTFLSYISSVTAQDSCLQQTIWVTETTSYIVSPNYPDNYPRNAHCSWTIRTNVTSAVITLKVTDLHLAGKGYDYVILEETDGIIKFLTAGSKIGEVITNNLDAMRVEFTAKANYTDTGFKFEVRAITKSALCGENILLANQTEQYLQSPGYGYIYPDHMECKWYITSNTNRVSLEITDFFMQKTCSDNSVVLYDGNSTESARMETLCGKIEHAKFVSTGNSLTVVFHVDIAGQVGQFLFLYTTEGPSEICNDTMIYATNNIRYLASTDYPKSFTRATECQFHIRDSLSKKRIVLTVVDLSIDGDETSCSNDYVTLYDGNSIKSQRIGVLCGEVSNKTYKSTGTTLSIVINSASGKNAIFKFAYSTEEMPDLCGNITLVATETAQYITSPGYPVNYPSSMYCTWYITSSPSEIVVLSVLDFSVNKSFYYEDVDIYDGVIKQSSRAIAILSGDVSRTQISSIGPNMTIVFSSGYNTDFRGFKLQYMSKDNTVPCQGATLIATKDPQYLTSPNYPYPYMSFTECRWSIKTESGKGMVVLLISQFSIEGLSPNNTSCGDVGHLEIYDGRFIQITELCGDVSDKQFNSTEMDIIFYSYYNDHNYKGFNLTYYSVEPQKKSGNSSGAMLPMCVLVAATFWLSMWFKAG